MSASTGVFSFNAEGNGQSGDNVAARARAVGGNLHLTINEPKTCALVIASGIRDIFRYEPNDDGAHENVDPRERVRLLHQMAPPGALLYAGNEPAGGWQKWTDWTLAFMDECEALGRTAVILNTAVLNPVQRAVYDAIAPAVVHAYARKHVVGVHEYRNPKQVYPAGTLLEDQDIGYFLRLKKRFAGQCPEIAITEFGIAVDYDPHRGWQGNVSEAEYTALLKYAGNIYAANDVTAQIFSDGVWPHAGNGDFNVAHSTVLVNAITEVNRNNPVNPTVSPTPPSPTYPLPESLGAAVAGYVSATTANVVNVRKLPSLKGTTIGTVKVGDGVSYRPKTFFNEGFMWTWLEAPYPGWVASVATITAGAPPQPEPPIVLLDVPFVSQLGGDADLRANDCGVAAAISLTRWRLKACGFGDMPLLKVDNLIPLSPLMTNDNPVSVGALRTFVSALGVPHTYSNQVTPDAIRAELDAERPVLVLLNYKFVKPGSKAFGHYLNVIGYSEHQFIVNDSYLQGEHYRMSRAELDAALTDLKNDDGTSFASVPYQGLLVAA